MVTTSRRCRHCFKAGAYSFNDLCIGCWNKLIEKNLVKVIEEIKKEQL